MQKLKVCFVGVGSIAKRHITNLRDICNERNIDLQIDALRSGKGQTSSELISDVYTDVTGLPNDYDVIFITNPTQYHLDSLRKVNDKAKHFFIEKPFVIPEFVIEAQSFPYKENSVYYVACPLRYKEIIQKTREIINKERVLAVRAECSSYLPEWRPGTDYRQCYSARKELGGGVSIDLIHEWDYLQYLFGFPKEIDYVSGKISNLEINTEDYASYIAKYDDKMVELHLDYFGRASLRRMTIYTNNDTIEVDLIKNTISLYKAEKVISVKEERDDFQKNELNYFLSIISGDNPNSNTPKLACRTINLTQGIIEIQGVLSNGTENL